MYNSIIGASRTLNINGHFVNVYYGVEVESKTYFVNWCITIDKPYAEMHEAQFDSRKSAETAYMELVSTFIALSETD